MNDCVNHPSHYETGKFECIEVMEETQGVEAVKNFCICNAFKYLYRHANKNGLEDIKKARWYLDKYIELSERGEIDVIHTTPVDDLQRQAESIESKVTKLNAIYEDYEDLMEDYRELERRSCERRERYCDEINDLRGKLRYKEEMLSSKEEQLENYRAAIGILVAVIAFYVALTVAI